MTQDYLVYTQEREHEACRRLLQLPMLARDLFASLNLDPFFSWCVLQMRSGRLVSSIQGDVDILAGPLTWTYPGAFTALVAEERVTGGSDRHDTWNFDLARRRLALAGGIAWPPPILYIVGIEAKCAYLDPNADRVATQNLKSTKASGKNAEKIVDQVDRLLRMGVDHALLLDVIANPPVTGPDGAAWVSALVLADDSRKAMSSILERRLPIECPAAHWVWSSGAIAGANELYRGSGSPMPLRESKGNSSLITSSETQARREEMRQNLQRIFSDLKRPVVAPAIFVDCNRCGRIHELPWDYSNCPASS